MRFVEIEEARAAAGLRLVVAGGLPSPWSQAAMSIFDAKAIDYVAVRLRPAAEQVKTWTGSHNAPVAIHDDEPPRTGWAEILALGERMYGVAHEILGEAGLCWDARLLMTHASPPRSISTQRWRWASLRRCRTISVPCCPSSATRSRHWTPACARRFPSG
jgi:hypothetical protein